MQYHLFSNLCLHKIINCPFFLNWKSILKELLSQKIIIMNDKLLGECKSWHSNEMCRYLCKILIKIQHLWRRIVLKSGKFQLFLWKISEHTKLTEIICASWFLTAKSWCCMSTFSDTQSSCTGYKLEKNNLDQINFDLYLESYRTDNASSAMRILVA